MEEGEEVVAKEMDCDSNNENHRPQVVVNGPQAATSGDMEQVQNDEPCLFVRTIVTMTAHIQ